MPELLDPSPATLADALDTLAQGLLDQDREAAGILIAAREGLRTLAWHRFATRVNRQSRVGALRRRHQGRRYGNA